jgi:hypothetical protein
MVVFDKHVPFQYLPIARMFSFYMFVLFLPDIGADVLDINKNTIPTFDMLEEEDTWFEMSPRQREYFENMQHVNSYLRQDYHSIAEILFKSRFQQMFGSIPDRRP